MAKYFGHKPSWRGRQSSGATPRPPVLEMDRQPSGEFNFSGKQYTPPAKGSSGAYRGRSVPNAKRSPFAQFNKINKMKQRMASYSSKFNMAMALGDLVGDPDKMKKLLDYGWDDFMRGDLPPPFDWLNGDIPAQYLPTKTPDQDTDISGPLS